MITVQDMTELLYIYDAYVELSQTLLGSEILLDFHDGNLGALSRIHNLIERNAAEELKKDSPQEIWKIAENTSIAPRKRAKILLMK